jgi:hypothetical protein
MRARCGAVSQTVNDCAAHLSPYLPSWWSETYDQETLVRVSPREHTQVEQFSSRCSSTFLPKHPVAVPFPFAVARYGIEREERCTRKNAEEEPD